MTSKSSIAFKECLYTALWYTAYVHVFYCMTYFRAPISSIVSGVW